MLNFKPNERLVEVNMVNLTDKEMIIGYELLIDSGADTCVAGKHAWISEIIEGVTVSTRGFRDTLPIEDNLPIVNAIYAYDIFILCEIDLLFPYFVHISYFQ